ncbi:DUF4352 domain-containing protein [Caldilinea sp.]|uniref:DUF4352 domain-containing protein n=1 Tax=Caldilinea sp. TaxID=2293560 RepID=UPI0021DD5021|nr:DUF4352 domain-containing protein [Caldilinea sp.]GIV70077.1 MAG: hypothetical protein KatS3mg048_2939 [Caldilinea sp.]
MNSKRNFVPFLALAILLMVSLACGSSASPTLVAPSVPPSNSGSQEQPTQAQAPTAVAQQNYKVGDIVAIGDHVLVVLGWENVQPNDFSKPDAGKKFVAVELLIVNNSQSAMPISTLLQMSMKDNTGQKYDVDFAASTAIGGGSLDGELAPGEKVRGKVGFQVAENATGLQFVFDASVWGTGKVFVDLGAEPVTVEPPASIVGETPQQTYKVGDVIQIGTVTLTVNGVSNPAGDQFSKPNPGNKFLVVDLTIENKGTAAITISTLLQMWLKDPSGKKYDVDLMASTASGGSSPDGEIAAGEKLRGQVGFQVPDNATGLVFVFDADVWGSGKVFVALP